MVECRSVLGYMIVLVSFATCGQSCPQLRECFPEVIETVNCTSNSDFEWVREPSTSDCSMYQNCFNGIGVQSCCPVGLYFNPDLKECDKPENVECKFPPQPCPDTPTPEGDSTTVPPSTTPLDESSSEDGSELDALCSNAPTDAYVVLPYPEDCNMYVECQNRELVSTDKCPAGLHFNPTKSVCDSPDHAECVDYICQDNPEGKLLEFPSVNDCRL
ncbi:AGAP010466-PA-like protein [Anopheles sinensis]|uniref:AGAP010466-PA-like protein n=1 Tax=Anopheles sinensis TaxID=74873 RepID=A0A084VUN2_ANOSI|nr:AGAP010466-PA-like protein [Anopheles sinensis]